MKEAKEMFTAHARGIPFRGKKLLPEDIELMKGRVRKVSQTMMVGMPEGANR